MLGEKKAKKIARNITKARVEKEITSDQLVNILKKVKKFFQLKLIEVRRLYLRIFVNKETTELINGIIKASKLLRPGGKY